MSKYFTMEQTLEAIYNAGLKFLVPLTLEETYAIIIDEAVKLANAVYGSIVLEEEGELRRVYSSSPVGFKTKNRKKGHTFAAFSDNKVIQARIEETKKYHPELDELGIKWTVFVPLAYQGKSIGVLTINSQRDRMFNKNELKILKLFGSMASLAIRKTQLYYEAKKAIDVRDRFISMAAHELRTPLTTISGYVQLLQHKLHGSDSIEAKWVEELSWELHRLANLINELLEVNRIKKGGVPYVWKEVSLREIVKQALTDFKLTQPGRQTVFQDKIENTADLVVGDFDKLLQVVISLLENAAKFSTPDKEIILRLENKEPCLVLSVIDKGDGIAKKELEKIFDAFYKGECKYQQQGMGLGLFLSKDIIDHHHGIIHVHTKRKQGTMMEINLLRAKI